MSLNPQAPFSSLPVRRVTEHPLAPMPRDVWPATIPAVRQLLDEGLDCAAITVLVGENGAGKSTIVEAIAEAFGLGAEGGTRNALHRTHPSESDLAAHLQLERSGGASRRGVFLRAETMHSHFAYLDEIGLEGRHNLQSHGESFIECFESRARIGGLWMFDEPESALSFQSCLVLITQIRQLVAEGSQVILSTHSPLLAALPGARILELGEWGIRATAYDDLDLVQSWRLFLDAPERILRHLG